MADVRVIETAQLTDADRAAIRQLLDEAFDGDFSDDDWAHALGGWHAVIAAEGAGAVLAHASVVERRIAVGARVFRAGYVEAVAVAPAHQRLGLGSAVMTALAEVIDARFELGVLSSGEWGFYERLGWERWRGPTYVRTTTGEQVRTEDDDDGVMVLRTGPSAEHGSDSCCREDRREWRESADREIRSRPSRVATNRTLPCACQRDRASSSVQAMWPPRP